MRKILLLLLVLFSGLVYAQTPQSLPFTQNWSNAGLITVNDDWASVPGIIGYRGDALSSIIPTDPQTIFISGTPVLDVNANQTDPIGFTTGGVTEFALANPTIALTGSGTADNPYIQIAVNTTGSSNIIVAYNLRDIDNSVDDAIQPIALQYRIGNTGNFINIPAAFVADASTGPFLASLVIPVNITLPSACDNQAEVQIRIIGNNAIGNDEWIGIDDISIAAGPTSSNPVVNLTASAATGAEQTVEQVITLTATASAAVSGDQTVSVIVSGTGVTTNDYVLSSNTITILNGQTTGTATLTIANDAIYEGSETFVVSLSNPSAGVVIAGTTTAIVVTDNEIAVNLFSVSGPTPPNPTGREASSATNITITARATSAVTSDQTVSIVVGGTNVTGTDYTLSNTTITILNGQTDGTATMNISDDSSLEGSETATISISTPSAGIVLGAQTTQQLYIFDNDYAAAPTPNSEIQLSFVSSYLNAASPNPADPAALVNSAEISAYDPTTKRLFVVNSVARKLNILDFSNPASITNFTTVDIASFGGINSVAVKNGVVAVAIEATNLTDNGSILFYNTDGVFQKQVTAGAMPDMITFSPNGNLVLTANEGEPSDDYLTDPEGTVTIVDIAGGIANLTQSNVTTVNFNAFDSQLATLKSQGLRVYGMNSPTLSKDLEPEYITFSSSGNTAFVTLQENNAIAELDIATKSFTAIRPLNLKDHNLLTNGLDASDQGAGVINIANHPIKGMYQPDAIASYTVNNETYLITANEGDSRVYPRAGSTVGPEGSIFNEEARVSTLNLDAAVFPNAALIKSNLVLGRLQLTNKTGDTDGDGDFDEIHALGSRSFSIWKSTASGLQQVFDSGDQLERIILADPTYGSIFNASNVIGNPSLKNRSDNKGPEPEGVTIAGINGKTYAFVALERIGGVIVYNVSNPVSPTFVQYKNSRSTTSATNSDLGAEGIFFIKAEESPTGVPLVVLSNEISSTISVYSVGGGAAPLTPTALTATASNTQLAVNLSWTDNASNETGYQIHRSTSSSSGFVAIGTVAANATTFFDNTILTNTTYYYQVIAVNDFGVSAFSNTANALVVPVPVANAASSITSNGFTANWAAVTGATEYQLDISSDNFATFIPGYNSKAISGTSEAITGLASGVAYQYRVRAVNGAAFSQSSNVIAASTLKQSQTITFTAQTDKVVGDPAFALAATSTSGLTVTFSTASDKITLSGSQVTIVKAGRAIITANQTGNSTFNAAIPVDRSFCIKPTKPTVTVTNVNTETPTLTSSATTGNQWFLNGNAISGATNSTLNATAAGVYKVNVKVDDCTSDFSADVTLIVTGDLPTSSSTVSAYPNPVEDYLQIQGVPNIQESRLMDVAGKERKIILEKNLDGYRANVQELPSGMYVLRLNGATGVYQLKFVKK